MEMIKHYKLIRQNRKLKALLRKRDLQLLEKDVTIRQLLEASRC